MTTLAIIGDAGSGKTHFATLLFISLLRDEGLHVELEASHATWNLSNYARQLGRGIPVEGTPPNEWYKNELEVLYKKGFGPFKRTRVLPIRVLDLSGEFFELVMYKVIANSSDNLPLDSLMEEIKEEHPEQPELYEEVYSNLFGATAFCFVVDAQHEWEYEEYSIEAGHCVFLENLTQLRKRLGLGRIEKAILVLTKFDNGLKDNVKQLIAHENNKHPEDVTNMEIGNFFCPYLLNYLRDISKLDKENDIRVVLSGTEWDTPPMSPEEIDTDPETAGLSDRKGIDSLEGDFRLRWLMLDRRQDHGFLCIVSASTMLQ